MRLILKSQSYWFPLLGALFFFMIGAGASLAIALTDSPMTRALGQDEAPLPFLMMSTAAVLILGVGSLVIWIRGLSERAAIMRVVNNAWIAWEQYDSEQTWRDFAEQSYQDEMKKQRFPWATLLMLVIIFSLVSGYTFTMAGADGANLLIVALPLGAIFSFMLILSLGGVIAARNKIRATRRRRLKSAPPKVYLAKQGLYSEDTGYRAFHTWNERLINVYYQAGDPATVNFQINMEARYSSYTYTESVRVPRGQEAEGDYIAHRYFHEGVVKR